MRRLAPSILSADFFQLNQELKLIEDEGVDLIHVDVMDGHFVPNISIGPLIIEALTGKTGLGFDVHLMIKNPIQYIEKFVAPETEYISIHIESEPNPQAAIDLIKATGVGAGISINPETGVDKILPYLKEVDLVLVMSVNPGFGGQSFMPIALDKIKELVQLRETMGLSYVIEVDGGIKLDNVNLVVEAGADFIVAGSAIFDRKEVADNCKKFLKSIALEAKPMV